MYRPPLPWRLRDVMVLVPLGGEEKAGHQRRQRLRRNPHQPDAVHPKKLRQNKNHRHLEDDGPQEGDNRRGKAVPQGGEEARCKDDDAGKDIPQGIDQKALHRHFKEHWVIPHKNPCQRPGHQHRSHRHGNPHPSV